jgi:broad specificity phosphatase PhoE
MALFRPLAALLLLLPLAASATAAPRPAPDYYVMRHLQKAAGDDPGLNPQGLANARRLVKVFRMRGIRPQAIYVSNTRRAHETAAPLAAALHVKLLEYNAPDTPALVARVRAGPPRVLIVGHSNTVPQIIGQLGGTPPPPLAETDFGDLWHVWGEPRRTKRSRVVP